jgi:hypothetical protein
MRRSSFLIPLLLLVFVGAQPLRDSFGGESARRVDNAISRAIAWLSESLSDDWRADAAALLGFLDRKFTVPGLSELAETARHQFDPCAAEGQGFPTTYFRLIEPGKFPKPEEIHAIPGLTGRVVAQALHCDWLPLDAEFWPALENMARHGGYGLTHAMLASRWIEENGCTVTTERDKALEDNWTGQLSHLMDGKDIPTDLRAEGLAMIFYAGKGPLIGARSIEPLLGAQEPDGGWALNSDHPKSHAHATALALWVLLEFRYPNAPHVPMIVHSSSDQ